MTADLGPAATPRPIPTPEDRMRDARQPAPTFATYLDRHDRDQLDAEAACARQERDDALDDLQEARVDITRLKGHLVSEQERLRGHITRTRAERDEALEARDAAKQLADFRQGVNDRLRQDLSDAGDVIAAVREAAERLDRALTGRLPALPDIRAAVEHIDRALAAYDTQPAPGLGSPADRAQDDRSEVDVPDWVLILVRGLQGYAHDHPKLYAQYAGHGNAYLSAPCPCGLLEGVPAAVRERAEKAEG